MDRIIVAIDHFSRYGEWKTILATNRLKQKLIWKIINNRTNLINSTSGSITCLSLRRDSPPNAPINVKPAAGAGEAGHRAGFWHFPKDCCQIPYPRGKNVRSNITKFPTQRNDLWSRARTKIQTSLPPGQQENSNALPPGQSDRSKSRPMPSLPPAGLTLIGT